MPYIILFDMYVALKQKKNNWFEIKVYMCIILIDIYMRVCVVLDFYLIQKNEAIYFINIECVGNIHSFLFC